MKFFPSAALALGLACVVLAPSALAQREGKGDPLGQFKREVAFHLGELKSFLGELDEQGDEELEALVTATVAGKVGFSEFIQEVTDIVIDYEIRALFGANNETRLIEQITSGAVGSGNTPPEALMPGACAEIEKFLKKLKGMLEKADANTLKAVKKAIGEVEKAFDVKVNIVQAPTPLPEAPAPGPGIAPQPPPAPKPVKISALGAGSDVTISDDGVLCVGGTADPALNGGNVVVTIVGPSGQQTTTATVDTGNCRWRACFTALREGNYAVSAHQGGGAAYSRIGVPGRPSGN